MRSFCLNVFGLKIGFCGLGICKNKDEDILMRCFLFLNVINGVLKLCLIGI